VAPTSILFKRTDRARKHRARPVLDHQHLSCSTDPGRHPINRIVSIRRIHQDHVPLTGREDIAHIINPQVQGDPEHVCCSPYLAGCGAVSLDCCDLGTATERLKGQQPAPPKGIQYRYTFKMLPNNRKQCFSYTRRRRPDARPNLAAHDSSPHCPTCDPHLTP